MTVTMIIMNDKTPVSKKQNTKKFQISIFNFQTNILRSNGVWEIRDWVLGIICDLYFEFWKFF
jgi:hypothetical protein